MFGRLADILQFHSGTGYGEKKEHRMTNPNLSIHANTRPFRYVRLLLLTVISLLLSCASSDRIVRTYQDSAFDGGPFAKILIVGVTADNGLRRRFEDSLVTAINPDNTVAVSSLSVMGADEPVERESLLAAAQETGSDAVLITRVLATESNTSTQGGRAGVDVQRRGDIPLADFFRYEYVEYQDPLTSSTVTTVSLTTDLFGVADETRVWSADSVSLDKASVYGLIDGSTGSISMQLTRDGFIR
jgi:hypothetical protein